MSVETIDRHSGGGETGAKSTPDRRSASGKMPKGAADAEVCNERCFTQSEAAL